MPMVDDLHGAEIGISWSGAVEYGRKVHVRTRASMISHVDVQNNAKCRSSCIEVWNQLLVSSI